MDKEHYDHEKLATIRRKIGKQEDVADQLGVTVQTLSRAENGRNASYELLHKICVLANDDIRSVIKTSQKNLQTT